ncbi:hypothetical protein HD554DRAFT_2174808 [Boletus coccyginus]|nr:hypothetical protein HD554DRAFT_2174808 [Boletus coccyginus]
MASRSSSSTQQVHLTATHVPIAYGTSLGALEVAWYDHFIVQRIWLVWVSICSFIGCSLASSTFPDTSNTSASSLVHLGLPLANTQHSPLSLMLAGPFFRMSDADGLEGGCGGSGGASGMSLLIFGGADTIFALSNSATIFLFFIVDFLNSSFVNEYITLHTEKTQQSIYVDGPVCGAYARHTIDRDFDLACPGPRLLSLAV